MRVWAEVVIITSILFVIPAVFCMALGAIFKHKGIRVKLWWKVTGAVIYLGLLMLILIPNYLTIGKRSPDSVARRVLEGACN